MKNKALREFPKKDSIAILMSTYNGEKYIAEQIESIKKQTYNNWVLYVSDDGSKDQTIAILKKNIKDSTNNFFLLRGPEKGFAENFLSLIKKTPTKYEYYAFSDQDDIWDEDKLEAAVAALTPFKEKPAIYCGRTLYVDKNRKPLGLSPLFKRPPSFENALVQSIAGGNTMVFNKKAKEILNLKEDNTKIVSHDWWAYLAITSVGGKVIYDHKPHISYRQHENNIVGSNSSPFQKAERFWRVLQGNLLFWNETNKDSLDNLKKHMTKENIIRYEQFCKSRNSSIFLSIYYKIKCGVHRQTLSGNIALYVAYFLKKI